MPIVTPLEDKSVVVPVPLLSDPVSTMSPPVMVRELLPVNTVFVDATVKLPVPESKVAAPVEVKSLFNTMPLTAVTATALWALTPVVEIKVSVPPDDTLMPLARVMPVPAFIIALPVELKLLFKVMPWLAVRLVVPVPVMFPVPPLNVNVPPDDTLMPLARVIPVPAFTFALPPELKLLLKVMPWLAVSVVVPRVLLRVPAIFIALPFRVMLP